jgi:3',5'-cyclic AMP phosphodiesterase CpdA
LIEDGFEKKRNWGERARLSYLSFGRRLDPAERRQRMRRALAEVKAAGVDHLVLTGDLTEDGHASQFEVLAELIAESRFPQDRITILPGNHDAYIDGAAFEQAMAGPLRPYASMSKNCSPIPLRDATLVPVSTAFRQSCLLSAGAIGDAARAALAAIVVDPAFTGKPLVFAQHHHPESHYMPLWQWIDGIVDHEVLSAFLDKCPHLYVVHGHTHRAVDRPIRQGGPARVFSATAVVDSDEPLRLYQASTNGLLPLAFDVMDGVGSLALLA